MTESEKEIVAWLRKVALNQMRNTEPMENKAATLIEQQGRRIAELEARLGEPLGFFMQHDETGRTTVIDQWQLDNGWETNNPRWQRIGPVFLGKNDR